MRARLARIAPDAARAAGIAVVLGVIVATGGARARSVEELERAFASLDAADRIPEAAAAIGQAVAAAGRAKGGDEELARLLFEQGKFLTAAGRPEEAGAVLERYLALTERLYGPDDIRVSTATAFLADTWADRFEYAKAEALYRRTYAIRIAAAPTHGIMFYTWRDIGDWELRFGEHHGAVKRYLRALAVLQGVAGMPDDAVVTYVPGRMRTSRLGGSGTEGYLRLNDGISFDALRRRVGGTVPTTFFSALGVLPQLARALAGDGDAAGSETAVALAEGMSVAYFGTDHPFTAKVQETRGALLQQAGRSDAAAAAFRRAAEIREGVLGPWSESLIVPLHGLGRALATGGDAAGATAALARAGEIEAAWAAVRRRPPPDDHERLYLAFDLLASAAETGDADAAAVAVQLTGLPALDPLYPVPDGVGDATRQVLEDRARRVDALLRAEDALAAAARQPASERDPRRVRALRDAAEAARARLRRADRERVAGEAAWSGRHRVGPQTPTAIRDALEPGEALACIVASAYRPDRATLDAVGKGYIRAHVLLVTPERTVVRPAGVESAAVAVFGPVDVRSRLQTPYASNEPIELGDLVPDKAVLQVYDLALQALSGDLAGVRVLHVVPRHDYFENWSHALAPRVPATELIAGAGRVAGVREIRPHASIAAFMADRRPDD